MKTREPTYVVDLLLNCGALALGLTALLLVGFLPRGAAAIDGVIEISGACAQVGCFAGDAAGYPVVISASGSYRLTSDLKAPDLATSVIQIQADDVALDLNGFAVRGQADCSTANQCSAGTGSGIEGAGNGGDRIRIANGTVTGIGGTAIALGDDVQVDSVVVSGVAGDGIKTGVGGLLRGNRLSGILGTGLSMGAATLFSENSIFDFASGGGAGPSIANGLEAGIDYCYDGLCPMGTPYQPMLRRYYLSLVNHAATDAATPGNCAPGFHFAELHELSDPSALQYDSTLGHIEDDQGEGPPAGPLTLGWVRTGRIASNSPLQGLGNCNAWTTTTGNGSGAYLDEIRSAGQTTAPWLSFSTPCISSFPIWCVED